MIKDWKPKILIRNVRFLLIVANILRGEVILV